MQQLSPTLKRVAWIGPSNTGGSVTNELNASRFQRVDRGDPTVTQIHFKRLALGRLMDRRGLQREPMLCHYAGRVWSTMWTWWDRSPHFALVHIMCEWHRGEERKMGACCRLSVFPLELYETLTSNGPVMSCKPQMETFYTGAHY